MFPVIIRERSLTSNSCTELTPVVLAGRKSKYWQGGIAPSTAECVAYAR